jgi:plasmid maintenance system antidote protein VapI
MAATTSIGQRFTQLIQQLGLSKNAFAMSLDKTATVIQHLVDERNKPGYDLICKVFEVYPNVSKDWLLLGNGPMLLNTSSTTAADALVGAVPSADPAPVPPIAPALIKPLEVPATPSFPAPLFAVSAARLPVQAAAAPLPTEAQAAPLIAPPAPDAAPIAVQPEATSAALATPASSPNTTATPPAPDATYLTAALHAQYLQHQLDLAEQRNQHLVAQQQLMQQMLDMLKRPA